MSNDRKQDGLDFLTEFLVEEVMSATDDEIQTEVEKEGRDIEQIASNVRSIYERAFHEDRDWTRLSMSWPPAVLTVRR